MTYSYNYQYIKERIIILNVKQKIQLILFIFNYLSPVGGLNQQSHI